MNTASGAISNEDAIQCASSIVAAYVGHNPVKAESLPSLLTEVYQAVTTLAKGEGAHASREPAVPVAKSVTPDHIVCLEDGKKLKMLKRYLRTHYDLSPEEYRRKWRLPADYPMTAPNYARERSRLAKDIGLGTSATSSGRKTVKRRQAAGRKKAA